MMDLAILILRISLAAVFIAHGLQAAFGAFGGPGINGFASMLSGLGFKQPVFWAYIGAYTELIGGLFLLLGIITRTVSLFLLIFMVVAAFKVHLAKGFFIQSGGLEYNFVIICVCLALIILGPGKFGLTRRL